MLFLKYLINMNLVIMEFMAKVDSKNTDLEDIKLSFPMVFV